ncbi:MAG: hypothetical protein AB7G11_02490 [Phycisphaerales bacterium]
MNIERPKPAPLAGPKYPKVKVQLTRKDGNAFAVVGRCREAAKRKGVTEEEISAFTREAMSGSYEDLLYTCCQWFQCR